MSGFIAPSEHLEQRIAELETEISRLKADAAEARAALEHELRKGPTAHEFASLKKQLAEPPPCWKCGAVQNPDQANCDHRYGAHGDTCVKCGKGAY